MIIQLNNKNIDPEVRKTWQGELRKEIDDIIQKHLKDNATIKENDQPEWQLSIGWDTL